MMKNYESMHKYMTEFDEAMSDKQGALNQINDALGALGHMSNTESFNEYMMNSIINIIVCRIL